MRRNTREPHARGRSALLALRALAPSRAPRVRRPLPARLARPPTSFLHLSALRRRTDEGEALVRRPPRGLSGRSGCCLPGPGIAHRTDGPPAVAGAHAAASAPDDGCRAAVVAGHADAPDASRPAEARARVLGRAA